MADQTHAAVIEAPKVGDHAPAVTAGHDDHAHGGGHHGGHDDSPEAIAREKRKYMIVFGMLGVLTIVTVAVANLNVPHMVAIALALAIATVKGTLVAAFFMHLISERKLIFAVLAFTAFFFGMLIWGPWHHVWEVRGHSNQSQPAPEHQQAAPTPGH